LTNFAGFPPKNWELFGTFFLSENSTKISKILLNFQYHKIEKKRTPGGEVGLLM
jgi:hypothetical protein